MALLTVPAIWGLDLVFREKNRGNHEQAALLSVSPLNLALLILMIMVLVSIQASGDLKLSLEKINGVVLGVGLYYAVVRESRRESDFIRTLFLFLGGGIAWSVLGFLGMDYIIRLPFLAPVISRIPRVLPALPGLEAGLQHNAVGGTILWFFPVLIAVSVLLLMENTRNIQQNLSKGLKFKVDGSLPDQTRTRVMKWMLRTVDNPAFNWIFRVAIWAGTLFVGGVLVLSQSRGSLIAIACTGFGLLVWLRSGKIRRMLLILFSTAIVFLAVWLFTSASGRAWIPQADPAVQSGFSFDSIAFRLQVWPRAVQGIEEFPLTGMGMNTFREKVLVLYPFPFPLPEIDIAHAHNEFLQAALDLGIPGLIAFLSMYLISYWMLWRTWESADNAAAISGGAYTGGSLFMTPALIRHLVLGLGGGLFAHMVFGMADAITLGAKPGIFFWYLLGLITGLYKLTIESSKLKIQNEE